MPDYLINRDPSGRATCQGSKEKIPKGALRMSVSSEAKEGMIISKHWKLEYFKLPRKFQKLTPEEFMEEAEVVLGDDIEMEEVLRLLNAASDNVAAAKKGGGAKAKKDPDDETLMDKIKAAAAQASEEEPKKKKPKTELPADFDRLVEEYKKLVEEKKTLDVLKDYLRWNNQVLKGTKDIVIFKILDGKVNGRLGYCSLDGGRLKLLEEDLETVVSMGIFDEVSQTRIPSSFKAPRLDPTIQRLKWFDQAPTEEEKEEMDKLAEEAKAMGGNGAATGSGGDGGEGSGLRQELLEAAENIQDWDLAKADKGTMRKYLTSLKAIGEGKIGFPEGNRVNQEVGKLMIQNKNASAKEIMGLIIDKYGIVALNEKKEAVKEEMVAKSCANPKNAKMVAAFDELATLYFQEGNRNAGSTYKRVASALKDLEQEVTAANALSFSKGKTKIHGIGPSSATKMKEFAESGTMEKLEEKRKMASS